MRWTLLGILLVIVAGCGKLQPAGNGATGSGTTTLPPGHELKRYPARLVENSDYSCLEVTGIGSFDGSVQKGMTTLAKKVIGTWGTGYGTEDYPSSYLHHTSLELQADGKATYWEKEGSEYFDGDGKIKTSMHTSKGPWEGTWAVTGKDTLEILLLVPSSSKSQQTEQGGAMNVPKK